MCEECDSNLRYWKIKRQFLLDIYDDKVSVDDILNWKKFKKPGLGRKQVALKESH